MIKNKIGATVLKGVIKTKTAFMRFPFMSISAFLSVVFIVIYNHGHGSFNTLRQNWLFLALESIAGIALFFSFMTFSERNKLDFGKQLGFALLGFCILGLHFYSLPDWAVNNDSTYFLRFLLLQVIFMLLASMVVFHKKGEEEAFWQYNQSLFITLIVSSAYSFVLFLGVSSAVFAFENLFEWVVPNTIYYDVLAFFMLFVNTLFFSTSLPLNLEAFLEIKDYKNALRILVQYVLLPILSIYLLILILYFGKLLMISSMPKGLVCAPILIFSILSILSYLLAFPIKDQTQYGLIQFFSRNIFYFLLPLLIFYFIGLIYRINEYGITEWRYVGFILGIWLALSSLYLIFIKNPSLIIFPFSLFILLVLGSSGPWGMFQVSSRSQTARLKSILESQNLLNNKVLDVGLVKQKLTDSLQNEIGSITKFLFYREKIELVYPLLAEDQKKQIDKILKGQNKVSAFNNFLERTFSLNSANLLISNNKYEVIGEWVNNLNIEGYKSCRQFEGELKVANEINKTNNREIVINGYSFNFRSFLLKVTDSLDKENVTDMNNYISLPIDNLYLEDRSKTAKLYLKQIVFNRMEDSSFQIENYTGILLEKK